MRSSYKLFIVFVFLGVYTLQAQQVVSKDSLQSLVEQIKDYYYDYNYKQAIESSAALIEEATRAKEDYYVFRGYDELGQVHYAVRDTAKARFYFEKALEQAKATQIDSLISWAYNNLSNVYSEDDSLYKKSIEYYELAIAVNKNAGLDELESLVQYVNIGWTYLDVEQHERAYPYLEKAQELIQIKEQHPLLVLNLEILFGRYHYYAGNDENSIEILENAANTAEEKNYLEQASQSHEYLAMLYRRLEQHEKAAVSLQKQLEIDKERYELGKELSIYEASAKFEVEQYQKDLEVAKKEQEYKDKLVAKSRLIQMVFIGASIILLIGLISFYRLLKTRKKLISKLRENNRQLTMAKNQAEKLSKLKTQFFSTVSHELRTPLYGVIGLSSILMEDKNLSSHKDDLTSLKFSADYLLALINDVLTLNKMDADGIRIEKTPFMLSSLLKNIAKSFAFSLEQNNNKIHLHIDDSLPPQVLGDSVRLSQVLMNLVGNAVKFNENGNIWVSINLLEVTQTGYHKTLFTVKDDGIGIPKDKQDTIFEEFSQIEQNNYNYQGTGLGLPIVKKLLSLFGSDIQLISEVGKGASFSFEIDLEEYLAEDEKGLSDLTPEGLMQTSSALDNIHVLVVDDNRINQKITQKILETRHFQCSLANDGLEAISLAEKNEYDLILMDIHMPNMNGIEATKIIRKLDTATPIVALTAVEIAEIRKEVMDAGMNDIILKPYDVSQFLTTILRNVNTIQT
ncbi:response regulator [Aureisphaera galaxeae]|uniref:tetratricopeptide repeat-containing hybrid sensor histidine kinase/response regulator n=1 Tax=Aureisphaera galaxeae TaxID=1538023 RepID=UPI002350021C|nr:response regulator [Aureisphaera galaxeae]MDC8002427.1 response regulator [Aureisphaera galaxeae]